MAVTLRAVTDVLQQIAPLQYAEDWDNVGLLVEPLPSATTEVSAILLTIDLTEPVVAEACELPSQLVVAYHPPIFQPLARLNQADPRHRTLLRAIAAGVAIYSPHSALDTAPEGVNDWLADGLGGQKVSIATEESEQGPGRLLELDEPMKLEVLVDRVKKHLGLRNVRVAAAEAHRDGLEIHRVALCAGAGSQVISGTDAQLYLTGEMRHHDVLAAMEKGRSVILCEHTNTERGYLPHLRDRLLAVLGDSVRVEVSKRDSEPLQTR